MVKKPKIKAFEFANSVGLVLMTSTLSRGSYSYLIKGNYLFCIVYMSNCYCFNYDVTNVIVKTVTVTQLLKGPVHDKQPHLGLYCLPYGT